MSEKHWADAMTREVGGHIFHDGVGLYAQITRDRLKRRLWAREILLREMAWYEYQLKEGSNGKENFTDAPASSHGDQEGSRDPGQRYPDNGEEA
jgi:hypothetical protein